MKTTNPKMKIDKFINKVIQGDALSVLKTFPNNSIDMAMTSPPYWTQRFYGGIDGEVGLENTPEEYIEKLLLIFKELKRVLKKMGTFWLNIDDVYYGSGHGRADDLSGSKRGTIKGMPDKNVRSFFSQQRNLPHPYLKKKDLCLIPFRLIDKLQRDGWYIRACNIWHKPNAMPENVVDRTSSDYEFLFLLTKSNKYYFDYKAIREKYTKPMNRWGGDKLKVRGKSNWDKGVGQKTYRDRNMRPNEDGRNCRAVWSINTKPSIGNHVAKFPEALCIRPIVAGCPRNGIVLDPFIGSGTTAKVAMELGRNYIGIELNPKYIKEIANQRIAQKTLMI